MNLNPTLWQELQTAMTRRHFFGLNAAGIGTAALASLLGKDLLADGAPASSARSTHRGLEGLRHFAPRAKRVIWLFQSGGPSQMELFDYKPRLEEFRGSDLPDSVRKGQRLTGMTATQDRFPVVPSLFKFAQQGQSGAWVSELMPHTATIVDELCFVRSMHTEAINHDPAITFFQTGAQIAGRPSIGAWLAYGLGSENQDLPAFVVMITQGGGDQPLYDRLWGSGFLPTQYQGVKFRSVGDPVLYLSDPEGFDKGLRRQFLDALGQLNQLKLQDFGDPEIATRVAQYEMAFRMQSSVPELADLSKEPEHVVNLYGEDARKPGTFAANCLLARRLAERGVRFIQLFHRGWDQHGKLPRDLAKQCRATDQASAALVLDLKARGLLDDTLVIWGGEFGRTVYCQGRLAVDDYGRDHHPRCFTMWMAGGGIKPGITYGATDDYSYNITQDPVHVHDLHATLLHCLGIDHTRLTFKYQGRHFRLTDVHGNVVNNILRG
jgi:hypothetical protein